MLAAGFDEGHLTAGYVMGAAGPGAHADSWLMNQHNALATA